MTYFFFLFIRTRFNFSTQLEQFFYRPFSRELKVSFTYSAPFALNYHWLFSNLIRFVFTGFHLKSIVFFVYKILFLKIFPIYLLNKYLGIVEYIIFIWNIKINWKQRNNATVENALYQIIIWKNISKKCINKDLL